MKTRKSLLLCISAISVLSMLTAVTPVQAVEKGDWLFRLGAGYIAPNDKSDNTMAGIPGAEVSVSSSANLALNLTYMVTDNWGVEVLGALPFSHDIDAAGSIKGLGTLIETKQLPPTFMAVYNFNPKADVRPYAGFGINYTTFMDEKGVGAFAAYKDQISLDDSVGLAVETGVDVDINSDMYFNASLWYVDISTTASIAGADIGDVDINPWVVFLGVGWKF